jgi:hypothetical protein
LSSIWLSQLIFDDINRCYDIIRLVIWILYWIYCDCIFKNNSSKLKTKTFNISNIKPRRIFAICFILSYWQLVIRRWLHNRCIFICLPSHYVVYLTLALKVQRCYSYALDYYLCKDNIFYWSRKINELCDRRIAHEVERISLIFSYSNCSNSIMCTFFRWEQNESSL